MTRSYMCTLTDKKGQFVKHTILDLLISACKGVYGACHTKADCCSSLICTSAIGGKCSNPFFHLFDWINDLEIMCTYRRLPYAILYGLEYISLERSNEKNAWLMNKFIFLKLLNDQFRCGFRQFVRKLKRGLQFQRWKSE